MKNNINIANNSASTLVLGIEFVSKNVTRNNVTDCANTVPSDLPNNKGIANKTNGILFSFVEQG